MTGAQVIWDDSPGGNVGHVAQHGLTPDEVDDVLLDPALPVEFSRSSGRPSKRGWTRTGKFIFVCWEVVSDDPPIVVPVTAYELSSP
jgi:hypothetical protein